MFKTSDSQKLKKFLNDAKFTSGSNKRIDYDIIKKEYPKIFDTKTQEGHNNFDKVFSMIFYHHTQESTRIKLMILLHFLMIRHECFCDRFQQFEKPQIQKFLCNTKRAIESRLRQSNYIVTSGYKSANTSCIRNGADNFSYGNMDQYLYFQITLPYYSYLMKASINSQFYDQCKRGEVLSQNAGMDEIWSFAWKAINSLKSMIETKKALTHIGRYYLNSCSFIIDYIQMMGSDISEVYQELEKQFSVRAFEYNTMNKLQLQNLMYFMDQMGCINDQLFEIFYNRYYHKMILGIQPQKWLVFEHELLQKVRLHYTKNYDKQQITIRSRNCSSKHQKVQKENSQPNPKFIDLNQTSDVYCG